MAALNSEGEAQKLRFGPWLVRAIDSGSYRGLRWINAERRAFRVPWKHNARRDVTSSDLEVFRAWAQVSGRYEGSPEDPAKWKTNFRCALRSTHMFELLEDNSKSGDDPHKVFAITPAALCPSEEGDFGSPDPAAEQQSRLVLAPLDVAPEITAPGTAAPTPSPLLEDMEVLQWVLKNCNISPHDFGTLTSSWPPAGDAPHQDTLLQPLPGPGQDDSLTPPAVQDWVSMEQPLLGACSPPDPMLLGEQGGCCGAGCSPRYESALMGWEEASPNQSDRHPAAPQMAMPAHPPEATVPEPPPGEAVPFIPATNPVPAPLEDSTDGNVPILDVSIYYRGKLFHQEEVRGRQCLLLYQPSDPALVLRPGHRVGFPSPSKLADDKQRRFTEELLGCVGLQLEQRARKLFATRLKKCKIFWALSQQLEGPEDPPSNLLCRDQEIPIFDFNKFCTELRDFRNGQRKRSPDFTIYLCFGQSFSRARPKESRLILVKLVPKFCEHWYEQVLREGASSLDSGTISLQLSDSFSLFELIEQCNMQID
uniref:IRF tryptophan pentad repeat domain-containing protein n=1 Tax=Falco tinnunculus TaxID=100819 RepID=A0A8C4V2H2_FALTI